MKKIYMPIFTLYLNQKAIGVYSCGNLKVLEKPVTEYIDITCCNFGEMYMDYNVSSLEFLKEFRKKLSEYLDKDITKLNDAKSLVKKSKATYQRSILNKI